MFHISDSDFVFLKTLAREKTFFWHKGIVIEFCSTSHNWEIPQIAFKKTPNQ